MQHLLDCGDPCNEKTTAFTHINVLFNSCVVPLYSLSMQSCVTVCARVHAAGVCRTSALKRSTTVKLWLRRSWCTWRQTLPTCWKSWTKKRPMWSEAWWTTTIIRCVWRHSCSAMPDGLTDLNCSSLLYLAFVCRGSPLRERRSWGSITPSFLWAVLLRWTVGRFLQSTMVRTSVTPMLLYQANVSRSVLL